MPTMPCHALGSTKNFVRKAELSETVVRMGEAWGAVDGRRRGEKPLCVPV